LLLGAATLVSLAAVVAIVAVLLILALLGEMLTPILQPYVATARRGLLPSESSVRSPARSS